MFCPHCGKEVSEAQSYCQHCGGSLAPGLPADAVRSGPPWEDRERLGAWRALTATLRGALFSPAEFFAKMRVTGGIADPVLFAMIVGMAGITASYLWQMLVQESLLGILPSDLHEASGIGRLGGLGLAVLAAVMPFLIIMVLFLWSGILHVLLLLVRGAKNGFEATLRAAAYSYSANVFLLVPFCGGLLAAVWSVVLIIIGLKEAQGISAGKSAFVVFAPLILCCSLALLVALLVFGTIAASLSTMPAQPWK